MGNSSKREVIPAAYLRPPPSITLDPKLLKKQIVTRQLAPFFPPQEEKLTADAEECPICFSFYTGGLNRSRCCKKGICTVCYLEIKGKNGNPSCPFCQRPIYAIVFSGPLSKEEKDKENEEERKVNELLARMKREEDEKEKQRQELLRRQSLPVPPPQPFGDMAGAFGSSAPNLDIPASPNGHNDSKLKKKKTPSHGGEVNPSHRSRPSPREKSNSNSSSGHRRESSATSSSGEIPPRPLSTHSAASPPQRPSSVYVAAGPRRVSMPAVAQPSPQAQRPVSAMQQQPQHPALGLEEYDIPANMNLSPDELDELMMAEAIRRSMLDAPAPEPSVQPARMIDPIPEKDDEDESVNTNPSSNAHWAEPNVSTRDDDLSSEVSTLANQTATTTATAAGCLTEDGVSDNDEDLLEMRAPIAANPPARTYSPLNPFSSFAQLPLSSSDHSSPLSSSPKQVLRINPGSSAPSPVFPPNPVERRDLVNPFLAPEDEDDPDLQLALKLSLESTNQDTPAPTRATALLGPKPSVEYSSDSDDEVSLVYHKRQGK